MNGLESTLVGELRVDAQLKGGTNGGTFGRLGEIYHERIDLTPSTWTQNDAAMHQVQRGDARK